MFELFHDHPGRLFVAATLAPLVPAVLLLLGACLRNLARTNGRTGGPGATVYWLLGGDSPLKTGGYLTLMALIGAATCAVSGFIQYAHDLDTFRDQPAVLDARWGERIDWIRIGASKLDRPAAALQIGYRIDRLTAVTMSMVTVVASLIVLFSIGYMKDEANEVVEDHDAHVHRRGRFGRFFLYLALFVFSMLNLLVADNLFQVFVSWELVGVCSFFLIGFYTERPSACLAANKAFLMNRVGDAGFLVGLGVAWTAFGTLNFQDLIASFANGRPTGLSESMWLIMGLGLFLGCVGKSAQFPLQTWLPDAMEGPTPVSALIHAATMVAAGVYLVGRCYPLFPPTVLLVIAYAGAITLLLGASIAVVQTDIKRVLAYSTVSQLGYMMLALGIGGWSAGLFHLLTHAFFKALLFLGAGSVIHGMHHEQDLRQMGGLRRKMPITASTMLVGVLAISGFPLFSGWYSKDMILGSALGFSLAHSEHVLLFAAPFFAAGLTAFYMFRLWFLAFSGTPRNVEAVEHAHESPWSMVLPLVVLAGFSIVVGWGWPVWDAEASELAHFLHAGEPVARADFSEARHLTEEFHLLAGGLALLAAAVGAGLAIKQFYLTPRTVADLAPPARGFGAVLVAKYYFDDLYTALFVRSTMQVAAISAAADKRPTGEPGADDRFDPGTLDGTLNALAQLTARFGRSLRAVQTGRVRTYVLVMALTAVGVLGMVVAFTR